MTIKVINGCLAEDILIDGNSIDNISDKKFNKIVDNLVGGKGFKLTAPTTKMGILLKYLNLFCKPISQDNESEPCEMCGETVSWKIYNI